MVLLNALVNSALHNRSILTKTRKANRNFALGTLNYFWINPVLFYFSFSLEFFSTGTLPCYLLLSAGPSSFFSVHVMALHLHWLWARAALIITGVQRSLRSSSDLRYSELVGRVRKRSGVNVLSVELPPVMFLSGPNHGGRPLWLLQAAADKIQRDS